ncbi:ROK family protein [Streptomyces sp. PTY087I2]|uniref:ROK family protein n=1 Tax=Streptomyces sp. PTY087I2 TaxID=1819298 RepID=UPI00080BA9C0|nr:ROK family protein [Streptomyces sp. PTY087I2]OCC08016.1 N-acetyl-D-glucosamine kinase [Streptomyces sp. PTY087I2]
MTRVPVLEIGGTHVTAALVDMATGQPVAGSVVRRPVAADAGSTEILDSFAEAARRIAAPEGARWGVAVPGPFDYAAGVGKFRGIGKFEALHDIDVGAELSDRLPRPRAVSFLNDADAFALGEHHGGAAAGRDRSVCVTLGTGVGSSFLRDGLPVTEGPAVPPGGRAHRISVDGLPLEEVISRRAIRARYARAAGIGEPAEGPDVSAIAELARGADRHAAATISGCFIALGRALAPWCTAFRPGVMVIGGSMAASWDLIGPALRAGLVTGAEAAGPEAERVVAAMDLCTARRPDDAPLIGAAHWALRRRTEGGPPVPVAVAADPEPGGVHSAARP